MKSKTYLYALMAMGLTLGSCSNNEDTNGGETSEFIKVSTSITNLSRVSTSDSGEQEFEENDQISIYAWTGDKNTTPTKKERVVDNSINTLNGNTWVAFPPMLWQSPNAEHYFIGIWPSATSIDDLSYGNYTFDVANQSGSDLLVAVNTTGLTSETTNPVPLVFDHVMAKLKVNLTYRNQWGGTPTIENVSVDNVATKATVNYLTKEVTASDKDRAEIKLPYVNENTSYASIMIPQTGIRKIDIQIGNSYFTYTSTDDIKLESGKYTTVNLIVGRDAVTLGNISISDWEEGEKLDGEAQN